LPLGAEIEELLLAKSESAGEQRCREPLDAGIVFLHRVVEEASRRRDLVLEIGELHLQLLEILVGLQVGIGLGQREDLTQRAGQCILGRALLRRALCRHRGVAGLDHRLERAALMGRVAFHGLDQVGDEIVALLELHIDVREGLVDPLPQRYQAVVDRDGEQHDDDNDAEYDPGGGRHGGLPEASAGATDMAPAVLEGQ